MELSTSLVSFFLNYKRVLKYLVPVFFVALFMTLRVSLAGDKAETDFLSAHLAYNAWNEGEELDTVFLTNLKTYMKKHPELDHRYEKPVLQRLMAHGELKLSLPIIEKGLAKVVERSSYYDRFGQVSLLVANGHLEKALAESEALKNDLMYDNEFWEVSKKEHRGSLLFAFNLMRIAMLNQSLEKTSEEYAAWRELKCFASWEEGEVALDRAVLDKEAFSTLEKHFSDHGITLKDYIQFRERSI